MVKIQELIKMGKMRGTVSCKTLDDCPADSVTKVQSQIRTLHSQNGNILRYTVLTITLDGSELLEKNDHVTQAPARHSIPGDADVAIQVRRASTVLLTPADSCDLEPRTRPGWKVEFFTKCRW